ncbi:MAG: hypothetical protein L6R45_16135 [Anaerolineae bacterium]|nr:hypothetical protein [Anaerolineae bacterium]
MAGRDGEGKVFSPGSRKRDRTIDDALRTMERLATWLDEAKQANVWQHTEDTLQTAMLHGMLVHLRQAIDECLALGGPELEETVQALRTLAAQREPH